MLTNNIANAHSIATLNRMKKHNTYDIIIIYTISNQLTGSIFMLALQRKHTFIYSLNIKVQIPQLTQTLLPFSLHRNGGNFELISRLIKIINIKSYIK